METSFYKWLDSKHACFQHSIIRNFLVNIPKHPKRALVMFADFFLLAFALWFSFSLRYNKPYIPPSPEFMAFLLLAPAIGVLTFFLLGIYKTVTRLMVYSDILKLHLAIILSVSVWTILAYTVNNSGVVPRSAVLAYTFFALFFVRAVRWLAAFLLKNPETPARHNSNDSKEIIIYGAGVTGTQLAEKLSKQGHYVIKGFIDDNPSVWKRRVSGHKIYSPDYIRKLLETTNIKEVILAMPAAPLSERKRILRFLEPFPLAVRTIPAVEDILDGRVSVSDLKYVGVGDLLGRDPVPPDRKLFDQIILDKAIMITGAGGSIGSELSRQIFKARPRKIVLFDLSEIGLYLIEQEILAYREKLANEFPEHAGVYEKIEVVPVIGSVLDGYRVRLKLEQYGIHTIFHAAAYKHVPLVESNPLVGIMNNVWGTKILADMALETGVERFVLISTDKAVRPTNIMGATKRLAEMYLQTLNEKKQEKGRTVFTMVRFGNVMDSSGSVIRKFRQQIIEGGPVTVTDPKIVRFFMSIPEAAELVIQAGAMAKGGEVYILDMGEPVKIFELAKTMIRMMGFEVRDDGNPNGDIEIEFIGLRPGEKLYEELLIEDSSMGTEHPRIKKSSEPFIDPDEFNRHLQDMKKLIHKNDIKGSYKVLEELVTGYIPSKEIIKQGQETSIAACKKSNILP